MSAQWRCKKRYTPRFVPDCVVFNVDNCPTPDIPVLCPIKFRGPKEGCTTWSCHEEVTFAPAAGLLPGPAPAVSDFSAVGGGSLATAASTGLGLGLGLGLTGLIGFPAICCLAFCCCRKFWQENRFIRGCSDLTGKCSCDHCLPFHRQTRPPEDDEPKEFEMTTEAVSGSGRKEREREKREREAERLERDRQDRLRLTREREERERERERKEKERKEKSKLEKDSVTERVIKKGKSLLSLFEKEGELKKGKEEVDEDVEAAKPKGAGFLDTAKGLLDPLNLAKVWGGSDPYLSESAHRVARSRAENLEEEKVEKEETDETEALVAPEVKVEDSVSFKSVVSESEFEDADDGEEEDGGEEELALGDTTVVTNELDVHHSALATPLVGPCGLEHLPGSPCSVCGTGARVKTPPAATPLIGPCRLEHLPGRSCQVCEDLAAAATGTGAVTRSPPPPIKVSARNRRLLESADNINVLDSATVDENGVRHSLRKSTKK